jgi:hypothetical protein
MKRLLVLCFVLVLTSTTHFAQKTTTEDRRYSVPDINGRATLLIKPELPGDVMIANDGTTVTLKVVVDTGGNVLVAKCSLVCPAAVIAPAEAAAMASKFRPLIVGGRAVKYDGILMYTIAVERVNWYRFGTALYSTAVFDNISLGPVAAMLTTEFADEKNKLLDVDKAVDYATRVKTIENVRDSLKSKLKPTEVWWFTLGMAVRATGTPFQSNGPLNREKVQNALINLGKFVESAPKEIPQDIIEDLKAASLHKLDDALSKRDQFEAVLKLTSRIDPDRRKIPN